MGRSIQAMRRRSFLTGLAMAGLAGLAACAPRARAEAEGPPQWNFGMGAAPPQNLEVAYLAGGCFWGVQAVFAHVQGVKEAVSGYAGGHIENPSYEQIGTGLTGHAETVRVVFDPAEISYDKILEIFFSVATDPTEVNRQGPDIGPQYRNEIFYSTPAQKRAAEQIIARLDAAGVYRRPIATKVSAEPVFWPAEAYHQDYLFNNPNQPYIVMHDLPKLAALRARYPDLYAPQEIRVAGL